MIPSKEADNLLRQAQNVHTGVRGENRKERNPKAKVANGDHNHGDTNGDRNHLDTDGNRADYDTFTIFKRNLERPAQLQRMSISDGSGRSFYTFQLSQS